jgi:clan AA aspartic protease
MAKPAVLEEAELGRVTTEARVENLEDLYAARKGMLPNDQVRRIELMDALVDTGATTLALPTRYIQLLGLKKVREQPAISSRGKTITAIYDAVRIIILGRECVVEVAEVPDEAPPLIGQVPLEMLDLVVNPRSRSITANPAHGGEEVLELL